MSDTELTSHWLGILLPEASYSLLREIRHWNNDCKTHFTCRNNLASGRKYTNDMPHLPHFQYKFRHDTIGPVRQYFRDNLVCWCNSISFISLHLRVWISWQLFYLSFQSVWPWPVSDNWHLNPSPESVGGPWPAAHKPDKNYFLDGVLWSE